MYFRDLLGDSHLEHSRDDKKGWHFFLSLIFLKIDKIQNGRHFFKIKSMSAQLFK